MLAFASLCRDLFVLAQQPVTRAGPARGAAWEVRVADHLALRGVPIEAVPGGCRIFGHASMSGLSHQIDGSFACRDALVIGEWKAYRTAIPKNELLRFKAATDDYYAAMTRDLPKRPIMRVFGGIGTASRELRCYAALHGIAVLDPQHWPAAALASRHLRWPEQLQSEPTAEDRRTLGWLIRPMQSVLRPQTDGSLVIPPAAHPAQVNAALDLHDHWSSRLWDVLDDRDGWLGELSKRVGAA